MTSHLPHASASRDLLKHALESTDPALPCGPLMPVPEDGELGCGLLGSDPTKHIREQLTALVEDAWEPLNKRML